MDILIATHNKQKLRRYKTLLEKRDDFRLLSLGDLKIKEKAPEDFLTNTENAKHKARFYGNLSGIMTIAIDEAVTTNFLPDDEQPGVYVRRFARDKKELNDNEVVEIWKKIFAKYPQTDKQFIWDFAIAFYNPKIGSGDFINVKQISYVASKVSNLDSDGYPLSRLLSPKRNGIPHIELTREEKREHDKKVFAPFLSSFIVWISKQNK